MTTATVDLTLAGTSGTIGGAVFTTEQTRAGTGIFNTFVQVQHTGVEQGYNTNANAQFDERSSHQHNHSILLADVPIFIGDGTGGTIEGVVYREFRFDANEVNGSARLLSLDKLQIWQEESGSLTNFTPGAGFAGAHTNYLAYDLDAGGDHWIALDAGLSSGSGKGDMRVFIPDSSFINDAAHRYVTLYSEFGLQGGAYGASGGFEEWGLNSTTAGSGSTASFLMSKTASVPGGTADAAGEIVSYTITLTNVGDTSLTGVTLTDPLLQGPHGTLGAATESISANGVLNAGETWTYAGTYTVQQSDLDTFGNGDGIIFNTATADTDQTTPQSASVAVPLDFRSSIGLVKSAVGGSYDDANGNGRPDAGETIHYDFTVSNTGNVTLHDASVSDLAGGVTVSGTTIATLAPGQSDSTSFTGVYTITQADIDAGVFENTAAASALEPASAEVQTTASASVVLPQNPHLAIDKAGTWVDGGSEPNGYADAGETIHYTFAVTNDGNVTLSNVEIADTLLLGPLAGPDSGDADGDGLLDVGEMWLYSAGYTIAQGDVDAGTVHNQATVSAEGPQGQPATATDTADVTLPQPPPGAAEIDLDKRGTFNDENGDGFADVGETISYVFTVTNTGGVTLHNIGVSDVESAVAVSGSMILSLAPGASDSNYSGAYTITQADISAGFFENTAVAISDEASDPDTEIVTLRPHVQGDLMV